MDGVLLVLGSGARPYREYSIASAADLVPLHLFDPEEPTWQRQYVTGYDVVDVFDPPSAVAAARRLAQRTGHIGVYCYHEGMIASAAEVAEALGLPGMSPAAVRACRDKLATRTRLAAAGVPQPAFAAVSSLAELAEAADRLGYPLVVKPRGLGASQGVIRVDGPADLEGAMEVAKSATQRGMASYASLLAEQYLAGNEVSVDSAIINGECLPFIVARKELGFAPYFEEVGHVISTDDPLFTDPEFRDLLARTHTALGVTHGITHTEIKFGPGGPAVIEVNGRLGGDLIPYVGQLASGTNASRVAVDLAFGLRPDLRPTRRGAAAIRFHYPQEDCRVSSLSVPPPDPDGPLRESQALVEPGDVLRLPPGGYLARFGFSIACAPGPDECVRALDSASAQAKIVGTALTTTA